MRRMPIRDRYRYLWTPEDALRNHYAVLDGISPDYPPVTGRLHTCYSPVRRSPARKASFPPAAPRLACVKPVASVHPEPGSNSSLLFIFVFFFSNSKAKTNSKVSVLSFVFRLAPSHCGPHCGSSWLGLRLIDSYVFRN